MQIASRDVVAHPPCLNATICSGFCSGKVCGEWTVNLGLTTASVCCFQLTVGPTEFGDLCSKLDLGSVLDGPSPVFLSDGFGW